MDTANTNPPEKQDGEGFRRTFPLRKNILILLVTGYLVVAGIYSLAIWKGADPLEAFNVIKDAIMGLVIGTVAISKDLVLLDSKDNPN